MTTQKLALFPTRMNNRWIRTGRHNFGAAPTPVLPPAAPASIQYPVKGGGTRAFANMNGRRTNLRVPFDTFAASIRDCPDAAGIDHAETLTINDGLRQVIFRVNKDGGGVLPGTVEWPVTTGDSAATVFAALWSALSTQIGLGVLELDPVPNGAIPGATGCWLYSHRSHPGMYGRGALFATTVAGLTVVGWGHEYIDRGGRSAYGRSWWPIRWGLLRGWTAIRPPPPPVLL